MTRITALMAALAAVAVATGAYVWTTQRGADALAACSRSSVAGGSALIGGPFELRNAAGETVTDEDVLTRPSLVYFGFTYCPDVCPLDLTRNAEALDLLQAAGHDVQGVFISVDPERDTPEVVGAYVSYMHDDMVGLTGAPEQVAAAAKAYKAYYRKQDSDDAFYLVDHSTQTYLMLPGIGFAEFFRRGDSAAQVAETTACFIDNSPAPPA